MAVECAEYGNKVELYRDHTNICETCIIKILNEPLTTEELQQRYNWF